MKPNFYHKELAAGGWQKLSFAEQMANIGSEIERAINWKNRNKAEHSQESFFRALELVDFTVADNRDKSGRLKELCRLREVLVDYFFGENEYKSSDELWQKYFRAFTWQASLQRGV
jgi:hypothetical protein